MGAAVALEPKTGPVFAGFPKTLTGALDVGTPNADTVPGAGSCWACCRAPKADGAPKAGVPKADPVAGVGAEAALPNALGPALAALPNADCPNTEPVLDVGTVAAPVPKAEGCPANAENAPPAVVPPPALGLENAEKAPEAGLMKDDEAGG